MTSKLEMTTNTMMKSRLFWRGFRNAKRLTRFTQCYRRFLLPF